MAYGFVCGRCSDRGWACPSCNRRHEAERSRAARSAAIQEEAWQRNFSSRVRSDIEARRSRELEVAREIAELKASSLLRRSREQLNERLIDKTLRDEAAAFRTAVVSTDAGRAYIKNGVAGVADYRARRRLDARIEARRTAATAESDQERYAERYTRSIHPVGSDLRFR
jgi:hypothetical protein